MGSFDCIFRLFATVTVTLSILQLALGDCECGYVADVDSSKYLFTEVIETDFLHLSDVSVDTDWIRQGYDVSSEVSRGTYGTSFQVSNIVSNPLADKDAGSGAGVSGGDAGMQLYVRGGIPANGLVPTAEIVSSRTDVFFGSFRTSLKLSDVSGTCGAFFWVS
jgi:hypothetical protein